MKTKTVKGTVSEKWGIKFPKTLSFSGPVTVYSSYDEIVAANDLPNNDKVVQFVNASRVANMRQKLNAAVIAAEAEAFAAANPNVVNPYVEPTPENNPELRWYGVFDNIMANKTHTREQAAELATTIIGFTPEDFDVNGDSE